MNLQYSADLPNSSCTCPICEGDPIPTHSSNLFSSPSFLSFREGYQKYPDEMFDIPSTSGIVELSP